MLRDLFDFDRVELIAFEREVVQRVARVGAGYASIAMFVFGVLYWVAGPEVFAPVNFGVGVVMAWLALRKPVDAPTTIFLVINLVLGLLAFQLVMLGGLSYAPAVWLIVPCVAVLQIGMRRMGIYTLALSTTIIFGVWLGGATGYVRPRVVIAGHESVIAASLVASQAIAVLLAFIILRARDRLLVEIRERNHQLALALAQARTAQSEAESSRNEAMIARNEAVAARNDALASRNEALAAARSKEQFFANLTHEIRTPLSGILGAAALLENSRVRADQRPLIDALNISSRDLGELVEAMLDHAKLSVGHITTQAVPTRLNEVLDSIHELMAPRARDKALPLSLRLLDGSPEWVMTDRAWLRRILINLLANAIKFTDRGSVELRMRVTDQPPPGLSMASAIEGIRTHAPAEDRQAVVDDHWLLVDVIDTGIGIAADKLEAVFDAFVQADPSITRRFGGTGLGLTISRRLAELLGGTLTATSLEGQGSTFTLILPVRLADPVVAVPVVDNPVVASGSSLDMKVLLVEDNPVNRLLATEMLVLLGCEVGTARDGKEAIEQARRGGFDLLLMDLQMPDLDGISAARMIRSIEKEQGSARVPIIALTGNSASDYGDACLRAGMDGFLTKPVGLEALEHTLREHRPPVRG